jgi:hypothetical protein
MLWKLYNICEEWRTGGMGKLYMASVVRDAKQNLSNFVEPHEANEVAHRLAKLALSKHGEHIWVHCVFKHLLKISRTLTQSNLTKYIQKKKSRRVSINEHKSHPPSILSTKSISFFSNPPCISLFLIQLYMSSDRDHDVSLILIFFNVKILLKKIVII